MKVAVSASGVDLNAQIDPRFGRCEYLLIIDTDTMDIDACPNDYREMSGGAGTQSAAFVIARGAEAVLTGNCGPKAREVFDGENIKVYTGQSGTVGQVIEQFKKSGLKASGFQRSGLTPITPSPGIGQGGSAPGQGQGLGGGRGMGGGGRGLGGGCRGGGGRGMGGGRGLGGGYGTGR